MTLVNPWQKTICPFCYARFHLGHCEVYSAVPDINGQDRKIWSQPEGLKHLVSRMWIPSLDGEVFERDQPYRQCPKCGQSLPYNIETSQNCVIGVIGGRKSSKTHYIASLVYTLRRRVSPENVGMIVRALTGKMQARYENEYYKPLYVDRQELDSTPKAVVQPPLVFTISFTTSDNHNGIRSINLVLFDVSGEDLRDDALMMRYARFLLHAKGVILLVDPLTIDGFVEYLPPYERPRPDASVVRAEDVLDSLTVNLRRFQEIPDDLPIPIPIAATLAKGDLLKHTVALSSQQSLLLDPSVGYRLRDSDYQQGFQMAEYQVISAQIEAMLRELDGPVLVDRLRHEFTEASFSAISATGSSAILTDENGSIPPTFRAPITPTRCADPLLWLFSRLGYLPFDL